VTPSGQGKGQRDGHGDAVAESTTPHERASATPLLRVAPATPHAGVPADVHEPFTPPLLTSLRLQQRWFAQAIMTPESEAAPIGGSDAARILTAGPRLGALDRLEVYRRAYHARLIECLADDYPALEGALGQDAFVALCRAYIDRHPSAGPNLNSFGRHMAAFCRAATATRKENAFAADLASLEWAIVEVIHAPSAAPLTLAGLATIPVEQWADAHLVATPAFRLLRFGYPVNAYFQGFREGTSQPIPTPADSAALIYRSGPTVWRMSLTEPMYELLHATASGESLGASIERAAAAFTDVAEEVAASRVMVWFRDWVASGLFSGVHFPGGPAV
jgi:hypothetical protein